MNIFNVLRKRPGINILESGGTQRFLSHDLCLVSSKHSQLSAKVKRVESVKIKGAEWRTA